MLPPAVGLVGAVDTVVEGVEVDVLVDVDVHVGEEDDGSATSSFSSSVDVDVLVEVGVHVDDVVGMLPGRVVVPVRADESCPWAIAA